MSSYKHFIIDFTSRSEKLFSLLKSKDEYKKHDVTLLLTFATPCFLVPYDRLKGDPKVRREGDKYYGRHFDDIYEMPWDDCLKNLRFEESDLFAELKGKNIRYGKVGNIEEAITYNFSDPALKELDDIKKVDKPKVESIIATIRNGLAHGNIFTTGNPNIEHIVLAKHKGGKSYDCLVITPSDFKQLLTNWYSWLRQQKKEYDKQRTR